MKKDVIQKNLNDLPKGLLQIIFFEVLRNDAINETRKAKGYKEITQKQYEKIINEQQQQRVKLLMVCKKWQGIIENTPKLRLIKNINTNLRYYLKNISLSQLSRLVIDYGFLDEKIEAAIKHFNKLDKAITTNALKDFIDAAILIREKQKREKQPLLKKVNSPNKTTLYKEIEEIIKDSIMKNMTFYQKKLLLEYCVINFHSNNYNVINKNSDGYKKLILIINPIYESIMNELKDFIKGSNNKKDRNFNITLSEKEELFNFKIIEIFKNTQKICSLYPLINDHLIENYENKIIKVFYTNDTKKNLSKFKKNLLDLLLLNVKSKLEGKICENLTLYAASSSVLSLASGAILSISGFASSVKILWEVGLPLFSVGLVAVLSAYTCPQLLSCSNWFSLCDVSNNKIQKAFAEKINIDQSVMNNLFKNIIASIRSLLLLNFIKIDDPAILIKEIEEFYAKLTTGKRISTSALDNFIDLTKEIREQACSFKASKIEMNIIKDISNPGKSMNALSRFGILCSSVANHEKLKNTESLLLDNNQAANDNLEFSNIKIIN